MELMVKMEVSKEILEDLRGLSEDSYDLSKILSKELGIEESDKISIKEVIAKDYIVHRLTDEDVEYVIEDSGDEEMQTFFEEDDNFDALCHLIYSKGEFNWSEELSQLVDIFYDMLKK